MKKILILKRRLICIICFLILFSIPSSLGFATGDIGNSQLANGLKRLIEDVGKYLILIAIPSGTAVVAYCFIRKGAADEMDHKKWSNRITVTIVSTIGAVVAGVIINVIGAYFAP